MYDWEEFQSVLSTTIYNELNPHKEFYKDLVEKSEIALEEQFIEYVFDVYLDYLKTGRKYFPYDQIHALILLILKKEETGDV
jgi:hypothetical protein